MRCKKNSRNGRKYGPLQKLRGVMAANSPDSTRVKNVDLGAGAFQHRRHEMGHRRRCHELPQLRLPAGVELPAGVNPEELYLLANVRREWSFDRVGYAHRCFCDADTTL